MGGRGIPQIGCKSHYARIYEQNDECVQVCRCRSTRTIDFKLSDSRRMERFVLVIYASCDIDSVLPKCLIMPRCFTHIMLV